MSRREGWREPRRWWGAVEFHHYPVVTEQVVVIQLNVNAPGGKLNEYRAVQNPSKLAMLPPVRKVPLPSPVLLMLNTVWPPAFPNPVTANGGSRILLRPPSQSSLRWQRYRR